MQSGALGCDPGLVTVCLARWRNSVQCVGNNDEKVLVYFGFNTSNYDLWPGKQLLADRHIIQFFNAQGKVRCNMLLHNSSWALRLLYSLT